MAYKLKNVRILVIEDNLPIRMLIRSLLQDLGFGIVDMAADAEEGWKIYLENKPDIILVDWRMDRREGIEFTKKVRQDNKTQRNKIPIIVMTGFTNKERVFTARDAGATEFLIKPFTVQSLVSHLTHIIERPRDFVITKNFVGPDRRRRKEEVPIKRRKTEASPSSTYLDLRGGVYKPTDKDKKD